MPRPSNNKLPKKNVTEERLRATPFESVEELEREQESIRLSVWKRFTEAQMIDELLTKSESSFLREEWAAGLSCFLGGGGSRENIYRIFSEGKGLKLQINPDFTKGLGKAEVEFLEGVVRAGIEGYGVLYMRTKGLIPNAENRDGLSKKDRKSA